VNPGLPLVDRNPTSLEKELLTKLTSCFFDGEGVSRLTEKGVELYYPNYTQIERVIAEFIGGHTVENKLKYDVLTLIDADQMFGIEVKSKGFSKKDYKAILEGTGRLYLELNNSPAKQHEWLRKHGISLEFSNREQHDPRTIGELLLDLYDKWNEEDARKIGDLYSRKFDLGRSRFIILSYQKEKLETREDGTPIACFIANSLKLDFKRAGINWHWNSDKCLRGSDGTDGPLYDWYPFSGGQFKYYPLSSESDFTSGEYEILIPEYRPLRSKVLDIFGD